MYGEKYDASYEQFNFKKYFEQTEELWICKWFVIFYAYLTRVICSITLVLPALSCESSLKLIKEQNKTK